MVQRKKAFTLVELLVVIAIIALLLSVLMPSLSKAREQARNIKCKNNLHQIGVAQFLYSNGNNDKISPGNFWNGTTIWAGQFGGAVNMGQLLAGKFLPLPTSMNHAFYCPSDKTDHYRAPNPEPPLDSRRYFQKQWGVTRRATFIDGGYEFRDSLDGGECWQPELAGQWYTLCKGAQTSRIGRTVIAADWYVWGSMLTRHKDRYQLLVGDGSVHTLVDRYNPKQNPDDPRNVTAWIIKNANESCWHDHKVFDRFDQALGFGSYHIVEPPPMRRCGN
jgi:prepilin-type N-terminal cleavage/methylation domain-containing protein